MAQEGLQIFGKGFLQSPNNSIFMPGEHAGSSQGAGGLKIPEPFPVSANCIQENEK